MKIKKNDTVFIRSGKDKGKTGKVLKVFPRDMKVLVEGVNMRKVHRSPRKTGKKGEIINRNMPIHASTVSIVDPKTKKPTRIGIKIENGKKIRIAKKSGSAIE